MKYSISHMEDNIIKTTIIKAKSKKEAEQKAYVLYGNEVISIEKYE